MKDLIFIGLIILLVINWQCKTTKIEPPKPPNFSLVEPPKLTSMIGFPININIEGLSKSLNKKFTTQLYKDSNFNDNSGDNLKIEVLKKGDFVLNTAANSLNISAPLHIDLVYLLNVFGNTKEISKGLNLTVNFSTSPLVDRDWNLLLNSKGKIIWDDLPVIDLGITKIDLPSVFGSLIQSVVNKMAVKIDKEVPKYVNIKKMVSDEWMKLSNPILLDSANKAWMVVNPKNVFITPIQYNPKNMQIKLGLSSIVEFISGYKPTNDSFSKIIPPLRQVSNIQENVKLNLGATLTFEQINESIKQQFLNKPFELESFDYKIKINDAKVFNYGNKLMIALDLDGKVRKGMVGKNIRGVVYATGVPIYNAKSKTIEIKQFDFELKTRDILLKAASWLVKSKSFKENIESKLIFPIEDKLTQARLTANDAVNKKMLDNLDIKGFVKNIEPGNIYITPSAIKINIITDGNLEINLNGF